MKKLLAASAMALAAGAADAAVYRYSVDSTLNLESATRYYSDPFEDEGIDVSAEYQSTWGLAKDLFEIDTSVFTGGAFEFTLDTTGWDKLPAGVTALGQPDTIWKVQAEFDAALNLGFLRAEFDDGSYSSYEFVINSDGTSSASYASFNLFGQYPFDEFVYSSDRVDLITTPINAPAPVPLPASALLLLTGLAALKLRRRG